MSSDKLRKYLAYYRKTLNEDPENIEARLRLAALFREMGRPNHAIDEYGTAAKLLASDGLPLEAIAACKAILELDPSHQETQLFLAKLYAEVPEATDESVRVARPLESGGERRVRSETDDSLPTIEGGLPEDFDETGEAITLQEPKAPVDEPHNVVEPGAREDEDRPTTQVERPGPPVEDDDLETESRDESTRVQPRDEQARLRQQAVEEDRETIELDVFDMESLGLDEKSDGWGELDAFDDVEEPDTREVEAVDEDRREDSTPPRRQFRISTLPNIPLFSQLPREVFVEVLDAMDLRELEAETEVLAPGDPASCLYILVEGRVRVEKERVDGRTVALAQMGEGEVFGEFRLLTGRGGGARVVSETDVQLLTVSDEVVYRLGDEYPELWEILWGFYYERMLNHALATNRLFDTLDGEERGLVAEHFEQDGLAAEEALFERGDRVDDLSLIVKGSVRVEVPSEDQEDWKIVDTLREGAFVGVSPTARQQPATATVRARTDVVLYQMEGKVFRELMNGLPAVGEAVRELIDTRQARTPNLPGVSSVSERI